ncbi:MAG: hypothetical protein L7F78_23790, partial [Syntrophales bacterium LBB04]|nr:hypothetical protein [Syntrophales bacterium LBB04]
LIQATGLIRTLNLDRQSGTEEMADGVSLKWEARLLSTCIPQSGQDEFVAQAANELRIYRVDFTMLYLDIVRDYKINVFKYRPLHSNENILF